MKRAPIPHTLRTPSLPGDASSRTARSRSGGTSGFALRKRRPSRRATAEMFRNLAVMVSARLPLVEALGAATEQTRDERLRETLATVRKDVERGERLAVGLAKHSAFSPLAVQLIDVGESTGLLGEVLLRLADHQEKAEALRRQVRQALVYPAFVIGTALAATAFLLVFVVPTFADLYADFDAELPGPTRIVLTLSDALVSYLPAAVLGSVLTGFGLRRALGTRAGRRLRDRAVLALPIVGSLTRRSLVARLARTLSTLLENGVPLAEALKLLRDSSDHVLLEEQLGHLLRAVEQGQNLATALPRQPLFPPVLIHLAAVGEATGQLAEVLGRAASHYEAEVEAATESLGTLLEPALIVVIGFILGGILVAMYLPMFDLVDVVGV